MLTHQEMAKRIRTAIEASGKTQAQVAAEFGVTDKAVSGWVRIGKIKAQRLPRLAEITGFPLSHFMPGAPDRPSQPVRDTRANLAAMMRIVDYLKEMAVEPMNEAQAAALAGSAMEVVQEIGAERILDGTALPEAAKQAVVNFRSR